MIIRKYEEKDWERICDIFNHARPDEIEGSCDLKAIIPFQEDEKLIQSFINSEVFVAEIKGEIVGFTGYEGSKISWLMVDPNYYCQGIGSKLFEAVLAFVGDEAYLHVAKYNERAKALYFKKGFKTTEEFTGKYNGYEAHALRLALNPN